MTVDEIVAELRTLGKDSIKRVLVKHGAREPFLGVPIEELKRIRKRIKIDHQLGLDLYDTGISDAMYLAGLIVDDARMTRKDLQRWLKQAYWYLLSESAVPWVASGSPAGYGLALEWVDSPLERNAATGWATLSSIVSVKADDALDLTEIEGLLRRVGQTIHDQPNRVRYGMNCFVIAVGSYVKSLTASAKEVGRQIGAVSVDMGETACQVPLATDYIEKIDQRGTLGKKRKTAKCA